MRTSTRVGAPEHDRPEWVPDTAFYQIFPDRFRSADSSRNPPDVAPWGSPPDRDHLHGGDLAGVIEGLAHLRRLGVTGLYLNPIFTAGTNHRYDTRDYFAVDPHLGDLGVLRELVAEAHHHGIRVLLDGVFNHCGDGHPAFQAWRADREDSAYAGWFTGWSPQPDGGLDYQTCGGADYLPKLNLDHRAVRDHVLRAATFWIEQVDIDGWRLDVPFKAPHEFWEEFRATVRSIAPDAFLLGEIWRNATPWLDVFDGVTNYRQRAHIVDFCVHDAQDGEDFAHETAELMAAHGDAANWMVNLVGSHDTARIRTVANGDVNRVRCALAAMFTLPGVPLIYYGDEVGLHGSDDPDCRRAMPWDEAAWDQQILATVTKLVAARADSPALRRGSFRPLVARNGLFAFERVTDDDAALVVINPRGAQTEVAIPCNAGTHYRWRDVISGDCVEARGDDLVLDRVASCSFSVWRPQAGR